MNLVWIRGPAAILRSARAVPGVMIDSETAHPHGEGWRVQAYASDEGIAALRAQGATVDVVMDAALMDAQFEKARSQIVDVTPEERARLAQSTQEPPPKDKG